MRPILRSTPARAGLAVSVAALFALGFVPLFDGPGYEIALGAGIVLGFAVAITAALDLSGAPAPRPVDAAARGISIGALFAFAGWLTTLVHGLRVGFCDAMGGSILFALGPASGALLAGLWGAVAAEAARGRKRRRLVAVLLGAAGPLGSILISVGRFYGSPMVFAYDPFVGFFSGTIYDTVIDTSGLLTYRAGSLMTIIAAVVIAMHLDRGPGGRLRLAWPGQPALTAAGVIALAASVGANALGYRLGHWQTSSTIAAALGARIAGARCEVVYPRSSARADMERFTRDCDAHVAAAERWFGAAGPPRITAFVFESAKQKGALMGAADTYIAKPWRREVYVQAGPYPHRVIGHELSHVVAGAFGRGPFRVAGSAFGLLPNPGLVEGVAVASEPPQGDRTPREQAKAMKDVKLLPPLRRLFALGFLGENAAVAYTVSGAFVGFIHDTFGPGAVRAWYGGRDLSEVTGKSWDDLERAWHEDIDRVVMPEAARAQARARFDRPAIFGRRCPHVIDACRARAGKLRGAGDLEGAIAAYEEVLALDPHDDGTRVSVAGTLMREGKIEEGRAALERLAGSMEVARHVRDRAAEELADLALSVGDEAEAARRYRDLQTRTEDEDQLRNLDVKIAAAEDPVLRPAVVALLVGTPQRGPDRTMALALLGALTTDAREAGMAAYLLARQYVNAGQYDDAAAQLDRALGAGISVPRVRVEAERLRLVAACALADAAGAARAFAVYAANAEVNASRRGGARALLDRCAGEAPPIAAAGAEPSPADHAVGYDAGAPAR